MGYTTCDPFQAENWTRRRGVVWPKRVCMCVCVCGWWMQYADERDGKIMLISTLVDDETGRGGGGG